jgi:hypothetical protein
LGCGLGFGEGGEDKIETLELSKHSNLFNLDIYHNFQSGVNSPRKSSYSHYMKSLVDLSLLRHRRDNTVESHVVIPNQMRDLEPRPVQ